MSATAGFNGDAPTTSTVPSVEVAVTAKPHRVVDPAAGLPRDEQPGTVECRVFPMVGEPWHPSRDYGPGDAPPVDAIDSRPYGEWRSRYPKPLHPLIRNEAGYLTLCAATFILLAIVARVQLALPPSGAPDWVDVTRRLCAKPGLAFAAGGLGGTLFGFKWLYHAVAKGMWHLDRRPWRLFTPWISAILASAFVALVAADVFRLLNKDVVQTPAGVYGVSFLVGYFSDITVGKLNEIAQVLLGQQVDRRTKAEPRSDAPTPEGGAATDARGTADTKAGMGAGG